MKDRFLSILYGVGVPVVCVVALVAAVKDGAWLFAAIVGLFVLAYGAFWLWSSNMMRKLDRIINDPDEGPEPTEAMLAVDAFDEAIHDARGVPLTDQVRLRRERVDGLLDRLRSAPPPVPSEWGSLLYELDALIQRAKPVPLTDEIRLDRDEVYDILDRMRAAFAEVSVRP
jgi:hypothetical protein